MSCTGKRGRCMFTACMCLFSSTVHVFIYIVGVWQREWLCCCWPCRLGCWIWQLYSAAFCSLSSSSSFSHLLYKAWVRSQSLLCWGLELVETGMQFHLQLEQMTILMTDWRYYSIPSDTYKKCCATGNVYVKYVGCHCIFFFYNNCFCWSSCFCADARLIQIWINLPVYQIPQKKKIK